MGSDEPIRWRGLALLAWLVGPFRRRVPRPTSRRVARVRPTAGMWVCRLLVCLAGLASGLLPEAASSALPLPTLLLPTCGAHGGVHICSGQVPSFDGTPLDVDLSHPARRGGRHPLVVMLH